MQVYSEGVVELTSFTVSADLPAVADISKLLSSTTAPPELLQVIEGGASLSVTAHVIVASCPNSTDCLADTVISDKNEIK